MSVSDPKKALKWLVIFVGGGVTIFFLVKYGHHIPPEVWEAIAETAEALGEGIGDY